MTIIDTPMLRRIEEALSRTGRRKKPRTPGPTTRALREANVSEKDALILQEGHAHEVAYAAALSDPARLRMPEPNPALRHAFDLLQEQVGSDVSDAGTIPGTQSLTMPSGLPGWTAEGDSASVYRHAKHGTVRLHGDRWTHHAVGGRIVKSGVSQESLANHLRGLVGDTGNSGAGDPNAEALADVMARARGERPRPTREAAQLVEAVRNRERTPASADDLRERLRKAMVRP
jgi:hypothetical protein